MQGKEQLTNHRLGKQNLFQFRFPDLQKNPSQDQEWCDVLVDDGWQRIRFHDYHEIYSVPGLYESLFYRTLKCCSPARVVSLLDDVLSDFNQPAEQLNALDVGAGNGMVGDVLRGLGVNRLVGVDIIDEAREAAQRDRPWIYDDYVVADLCDLPEKVEKRLRQARLNTLTTVAALGFGDIPTRAFLTALDLIDTPGWLAFNIKEDFLDDGEGSGFCELIRQLAREGTIQIQAYRRYRHRLSVLGHPLHYVAVVATKQRDVPDHHLESDE